MRKELILILSLLWILSCNSGMENDAMKSEESTESEMTVATENIDEYELVPNTPKTSINFQEIASQKLQEYVELQNLINEHPEFEPDIAIQLSNYTSDSLLLADAKDIIRIDYVTVLESNLVDTDSITKVKLGYTMETSSGSKSDSIMALFRLDSIKIDGEFFTSTKVTFESLKD